MIIRHIIESRRTTRTTYLYLVISSMNVMLGVNKGDGENEVPMELDVFSSLYTLIFITLSCNFGGMLNSLF